MITFKKKIKYEIGERVWVLSADNTAKAFEVVDVLEGGKKYVLSKGGGLLGIVRQTFEGVPIYVIAPHSSLRKMAKQPKETSDA